MSKIETFKSYCSFCRKDLSKAEYEFYKNDLLICLQCKDILTNDPVDDNSPIVLFDDIPVLQSDAKVLQYFENELNLPLPAITLRNFLTEDEVYGYLIDDTRVVGLGLDGADLESLSAIILNLSNLKYLSIKNNVLKELPAFIDQLITLELLDFSKNFISQLPSLQHLEKLNHLVFRDNLVETLPTLPPNLQSINARWNRLRFLNEPFPGSIKRINLAQNRIVELSNQFSTLRQVEELNLYGNQLTNLPDVFNSLYRLKILILRVNKLVTLPESIGSLSALEILDVEENNLSNIPDLSKLSSLKNLNISKNNLSSLSGLQNCKELSNLDIRDNKFIALDVSNLPQLKGLDISYNDFTTLPRGLESKSYLVELIASGNGIKTIEQNQLNNLLNLTRLSLAKNKLIKIPDLSSLPNLQELYVNNNELDIFPEWLKASKLKVLIIDEIDKIEKEEEKEKVEFDNLNSWFE